ncbi:uncharacterized protein [Primulina huaijiensis]|uniref:uncharacterized protein isoform X2 n=1 Tax=Primulina huaijiensis TaxID=1492673 RepID=UPI003CC70530
MAAPSSEERDVSADAWNTEMEEELKRVLLEYGNRLLKPGDSIEELLRKLDKLEHLLQHLMQDRKPLIEMALKPAEEALISNALMRHKEVDVRITVVSCISEIIRLTAPKEPYDEDQMKAFFKLVNTAYQKLPSLAGRAYSKAVSIIQTVSSCQTCVLMLDLELHDTVVEMFHLFLDGIQSTHPQEIPSSMENIMVLMIQNAGDSEEFAVEAAKILLSTLKKGNENVSPCAFQLARKVYEKCANDLKNYLPEAVRHMGVAVQEYDDVVISSLHGTTQSDDMNAKEIGRDACCRGEVSVAGDLVLSNLVEKNFSDYTKAYGNINENNETLPNSFDQINWRENVLQEAKDKGIEACCHGEVNLTEDGGLSKLVENNGNDNLQDNENTNEYCEMVTHVGDQINQQKSVLDRNNFTSGPDVDRINSDILIDNSCLGEGSSQGVSSAWMPFEQVSLMKHHDAKHNDDSLEKNNSTNTFINGPPVEIGGTHHMQQELKKDDSPILRKRIRKPSSIIRAEEGYDPLWMLCECASIEDSHHRKNSRSKNSISKSTQLSSSPEREPMKAQLKPQKKFSQEKKDGTLDEDNGLFLLPTSVNNLSETMISEDIADEECIKERLAKRSGKNKHACMTDGMLKNPMKRKRSITKVAPRKKVMNTNIVLEATTSKDSDEVTNLKEELSKVRDKRLPANSIDGISKNLEKGLGTSNKVDRSEKELCKSVRSEDLSGDILRKISSKKKRQHSLAKKALGETSKGKTIVSENLTGDTIVKVNGAKKSDDENLVGCKIKVWWPLDETYYEGKVTSFDHLKETHKVDYDDGETEILDLTKELWDVIDDNNLCSHEQKTVPPPPSGPRAVSHGRRGKSPRSSEAKPTGLWKQILG